MTKINLNTPVYFADFECLTYESKDFKNLQHTDVYLWHVKSIDGLYEQTGYSLDTFMKWCHSFGKSILVYFHNLSYDGNFIYKWLLRNRPEQFSYFSNKLTSSNRWEIFSNGNKIYSIDVFNKKWKYSEADNKYVKRKFNIYFRCTYNLLNSSISALGECFNLDKHNEDTLTLDFYDKGGFNMDDELKLIYEDYIKRDVEIARLSYIEFNNVLQNHLSKYTYSKKFKKTNINLKNKLTIGSICYSMMKNHVYNKFGSDVYKGFRLNKDDYVKAKNWYYGGFTQFNPKYQDIPLDLNGCSVDINSSYPFQMTKLLPYGKMLNKPPKGNYLTYYQIEIKSALIKPEYKDFVILKKWDKKGLGRYVRYMNEATLFYCKDEWELIQQVYDFEIKSIKTYYCKAEYLFKELIEDLYAFKVKYDKENKKALKTIYKIFQNAGYGKNCTRMSYDILLFINPDNLDYLLQLKENEEYLTIEDDKGKLRSYEIVGESEKTISQLNLSAVRIREVASGSKKFTNILIGAQIASYARVQLWSSILKTGVENFLYADTDSIFTNITPEKVSKLLNIDDYELGAWKIETTFYKGRILGAKRYAFINEEENKIKFGFAGIKKDIINLDNWDSIVRSDIEIMDGVFKRVEDDYGIYFKYANYKTKKGDL